MDFENGTMNANLAKEDLEEVRELPHIRIIKSKETVEEEIADFLEKHQGKELRPHEKFLLETMKAWLTAYEEEWQRRINYKPPTIEEMTDQELQEAHWEVDDDRKYFCRERRGKTWTKEDEETYENMNAYAQKLMDEKIRRRQKKE